MNRNKKQWTVNIGILRQFMLLCLMALLPQTAWTRDWILDDGYFKAIAYSDHVRFEVLLCDLYGKNTYSKGGYIYASGKGSDTSHHKLIYLEYDYDDDDKDSNPTADVKAYVVCEGAKAFFDTGDEIPTSEKTFSLKKWSSDKDYLTAYIDFYYPAELAGVTWNVHYNYDHSNGSHHWMTMNENCEFRSSLGLSTFDASDYTCERTSPDKIKFTVPSLPTISGKMNKVRERFCSYDVAYTFTKQDGTTQVVNAAFECVKDEKKSFETTIPIEVGNPKQIDVNISARQGVKDATGIFWDHNDHFNKPKYFRMIPQSSGLAADYRQFDKAADLTWSQPVDADTYLECTPYVYRIETDERGNKLSGQSWRKCDAVDWEKNKTSLSYSDDGVPLGHYYQYMVLNVPDDWINKSITSMTLSNVTDDLISRLGGHTGGVLSTIPEMSIYDLKQDTTVTDKVRLTWKYSRVPVDGSTVKFNVLRRTTEKGQWADYGQPINADANPSAGTEVEVIDESLPNVTTRYSYKVQLTIDDKYTFKSNEVTAGLLRGTQLKDFEATKGVHEKAVTLTWRASRAGTDDDLYVIKRRYVDSGEDFQQIASPSGKTDLLSYNDDTAKPGYYYEYKLEVYSGNVLQNVLYDVGYTQSRGKVSGTVNFRSESNATTPVEDVRITLQSLDTGVGNTMTGHSMRVDGASTGIQWQADSAQIAKVFGPDKDYTVQMFVRPDTLLSEGAVIGEIPGEGRLVVGKQKDGDYELMLQKVTGYVEPVKVAPTLPASTKTTNLSTLTGHYTAENGETLTGKLSGNYKISVADGATVYIKDVTIDGRANADNYDTQWAGITCMGDATIVLEGENFVTGFFGDYAGIEIGQGKTLTIKGTGTLTAIATTYAAGIGASINQASGNIIIEGGTINATGGRAGDKSMGNPGSGIGGSSSNSQLVTCGDIMISGGTINAVTNSHYSSAIGGYLWGGTVGTITITNTVSKVTASGQVYSINPDGKLRKGGTVTIGGTVYWDGSAYQNDGANYLSQNPLTYTGDGSWITTFKHEKYGYTIPGRCTYGTATATGLTLSSNTYSLLTVSRTGDNLQFQVDDGEAKTLTATKYKYLAPFSVGGADSVKTAQAFKGYLSEVRVWANALSDKEKASCNDRVLSGRESGLKLYWPLDEGMDRYAFDASYASDQPNGRHATVGGNITSSTILPAKEQLSRYGLTNKEGYYEINSVPYVGSGTTYTVTPSKGIHEFDPVSKTCNIGNGSLNFNGYDFTDKSSFPMRGKVTYQYTDIPVDSVQFKIDGVLKQNMTDSNGEYELNVPIGSHRIEAYRQGHRLTGFPLDGGTYEFKRAETVNFVDSTLVNVTGRVNGGASDKNAPIGFKQSKNRIGQATIKLSLGKESNCSFNYVVDSHGDGSYGTTDIPVASASTNINSTAWRSGTTHEDYTSQDNTHYIYIKTDPETGEFSAMLPPLRYKVESISFAGDKDNIYNNQSVFAQNLPVLDARNAIKERMKCDTLANGSQKYEYSAKMVRQYRSTPTIHVAQTGLREGVFGEKRIMVTNLDNSTDTVDVLTLTSSSHSYRFKYPIFRQNRYYNFGIDVAEEYTNCDTGEEFQEIPTDATVRIINDASSTTTVFGSSATINNEQIEMGLPYQTMQVNVKPNEKGHIDYTFEAGWPNFAEGHLLSMSISVQVDGRTTVWQAPQLEGAPLGRTALEMIVLGSISTGTNFMTEGPPSVDMVLRRPPGSSSVATLEDKTITSFVHTNIETTGGGGGGGAYISEAPTIEVIKGEAFGIALLEKSTVKGVIDQTITYNETWSDAVVNGTDTAYTVVEAKATPNYMQYVDEHEAYEPEGGDTYIGRSTNLLFSKGRLLGIFKNGDDYEIGDKEGVTVGQRFSTAFVFPQAYILNTLIPEWEAIIKSKLQEGYIEGDHADTLNCPRIKGKVIYYTKYKPGDEKFGTGNADSNVWTAEEIAAAGGCPSYRMINGTGNPVDDEVQNAIIQIKTWRARIADNEQEKLEAIGGGATLLDNVSFASGTKVSRSTTVQYQSTQGKTHTTEQSVNFETHLGAMWNNAGAYAIIKLTDTDGSSERNDTITTKTRTVSWTMNDNDYRTALSVDVYEPKSNWGPIFITRGGQTANPYEGETRTMFYQPGTKLNEATMQVELPQLKVDGSAELTDIPTGTQAQFKLALTNMSETKDICTYVLEVKEKTNPNGAILTIDGNILSNGKDGRTIKMKGGETIYKTLIVTQSDKSIIDYDDIVLVLRSQNDATISSEPVKLHVHFVPSSSPVDLSVDHTVLNSAYLEEHDGITATMYNLNRQDDNLQGLRLRYRRKGTDKWNLYGKKQWTTIQKLIGDDYEAMPNGNQITRKVTFDDDGVYELQAQTFGLYGNENSSEEVTYESNIVEVVQDTHGPQLLGMVSPEDGLLTMKNLNNMHLRFNEQMNTNALSKSANFRIEGGLNNVVAEEGRAYPDVAVQLNGDSIETEAMYDLSSGDFACDMWFYRQGDGTIISLGTEDNLLALSTHDGGKLQARVGKKNAVFDTGKTLPKDKWMYMALNYKRKSADHPKNTITMLYSTADDNHPIYVGENVEANNLEGHGRLSVGGGGMKGMVGRLSIWNSDVTAQDLYLNRQNLRAAYTPGLVGYWKMDEGHGTQVTDVARSRHMQMPAESWYINNENRAAHLDGEHAMKVNTSTFATSNTDNFAYEMWFRGTETDNKTLATLMSVRNSSTEEREAIDSTTVVADGGNTFQRYTYRKTITDVHSIIGFDNGILKLKLQEDKAYLKGADVDSTSSKVTTDVKLSDKSYLDGQWHHLALNVRRGTSAIVYLDGQAVKTLPEASVPGISATYLVVGGELNGDTECNHFKGDVDEVRIWNAALDGGLIKDRMYERMDNSYPGLKGYFPMESIHRTEQGNIITEFSLDHFGESNSRLTIVRDSVVVGEEKVPVITQAANAPALKPGSTKLRLDDSDYEFTASSDEIYFSFTKSSTLAKMDDNDFVATVSYIKDEHGNESQPVSWKFHCDFACLKWNIEEDNLSKPWNEVMEWLMYVANQTGTSQSFELSGMPTWLTVDKTIGTITGDGGYVTFRLGTDVPVGRHTEYIYLTDQRGIRRVLKLNLTVTGDVPNWTVDPDLYESNMTMTGQIYIDDKICENTDTKIAAFDDLGLCRGVASPKYVTTRDAYYVDMILYGASSTDLSTGIRNLTFKVYDASTGTVHPMVGVTVPDMEPSLFLQYTPDVNYGSYDKPVVLEVANALEQKISLAKGWTWMSIYVEPLINSIEWQLPRDVNILKRFKNMRNQVDGFSTVDKNGKILGELTTLEPGKMYKMQLSTKTDFDLVGLALDTKNQPQIMHPGYNWIGTLSSSVMSVAEAFAELAPEPGDRVKSRTAFAEYSNKGYWEGTLESIVPGQGYIYRSMAAKEKTFHYPSGTAATQRAARVERRASAISHFTPVDPYLYPDNINIIAVVKKDGQERDDAEIGAVINGECRGAISCNNGYYFLTVMGSSEEDSERKMELRVYVDGDEYTVDDTLPFFSDASYGSLDEPYVLNLDDATGINVVNGSFADDDSDWWTLQGFKIGHRPTQPGVYIHRGQKTTIQLKK